MSYYNDTHPDIERLQVEHFRRTSSAKKLAMVASLNQTLITLALSGLRQRYPDDSPARLRRRLAEQIYGKALIDNALGTLPHQVETDDQR